MKLSQKKTCNRCAALDNTIDDRCKLGFKTKRVGQRQIKRLVWTDNEHRPIEPCPKPLTIGTYMKFRKEIS